MRRSGEDGSHADLLEGGWKRVGEGAEREGRCRIKKLGVVIPTIALCRSGQSLDLFSNILATLLEMIVFYNSYVEIASQQLCSSYGIGIL